MTDEIDLKLIRAIEDNPSTTQRELSKTLGVSLGKANYCLRTLIENGWVKTRNLKNGGNKLAYEYTLTPTGLAAKSKLMTRFLQRKIAEYEALKTQIAQLYRELESDSK